MKKTLKQKAYEQVLLKITRGELRPGERLSEVAMAKEIGLSPTPLREAYRQLAGEGFLQHVPNAGMFVRRLDAREVKELYEAREALEVYAVGKAAARMGDWELDGLRQCRDRLFALARAFRDSGEEEMSGKLLRDYLEADADFHRHVIAAAENTLIQRMANECHVIELLLGRKRHKHTLRQVATTCRHHGEIFRAIKRGKAPKAEQWARKHIMFSMRTAVESMNEP